MVRSYVGRYKMLSRKNKITTLYWIAILGILGARTMKMISYIYNQNKKRSN
jgi:hypothetical protein